MKTIAGVANGHGRHNRLSEQGSRFRGMTTCLHKESVLKLSLRVLSLSASHGA